MLKEQLRNARKAAGKTQKEVATHLGVTESTYCGYETGKRQPDAIKLKMIANYLGVSGDVLLETDIEPESGPEDVIVCTTPEEVHIIRCYRSLNASGKSIAVSAISGISSNQLFHDEIPESVSNPTTQKKDV